MEATHEAVLSSSPGAGARTVRRPAPRRGPGRDRGHALGGCHPALARRPAARGVDHRRHAPRAGPGPDPGLAGHAGRQPAQAVGGRGPLAALARPPAQRPRRVPRRSRSSSRGAVSSRCYRRGTSRGSPTRTAPPATCTLVRDQVAAHTAALDHLAAQPASIRARIAVVGHDYGGMYGALLADRDDRVSTLALQAPDTLLGNWFAAYWLELEGEARADYARALRRPRARRRGGPAGLARAAPVGRPGQVRDRGGPRVHRAEPAAQHRLDRAHHQLDGRRDRDLVAFLAAQLGLGDEPTARSTTRPGPRRCLDRGPGGMRPSGGLDQN